MPLAVCAVVLALLVAGSVAFGESSGASAEPARSVAPVPVIARRVEAIRKLRFDEIPRPVTVDGEQARREGLEDLDKTYPPARRRADEELYKLLGLLEPEDDLRTIASSVFEGQVSGYYDPRTGQLRVVRGGGAANPVMEETTLAHELTHALEDQRFELDLASLGGSGDPALAYTAMVEGTATALMDEYQRKHFKPSEALGGAAAAAFAAPSTGGLPPFITAQLLFPYLGGQAWVNELYATAGRTWRLVDVAQRARPPASTEQVMHPRAWLRAEQPVRVPPSSLQGVLGPRWRAVTAQTFGEWQTREWLRRGDGEASEAAEGWGGDRLELWQRRGGSVCSAPCTERDVLVMRWVWDTVRDAAEFRAAVGSAVEATRPPGGAAAVGAVGRSVTVVWAPTRALARKISQRRAGIR